MSRETLTDDQERTVQATMELDLMRDPDVVMDKDGGRPRRVALHLPLRYRSVGDPGWHEARTENISRVGVLFRTTEPLEIDTQVEMTFVLPAPPSQPEILCRGRIVRTVLPDRQGRVGLAATISAYRFVRGAT
jgi:hypothetical protein